MSKRAPSTRDRVKWYFIFGIIFGGAWGWSTGAFDLGEQWLTAGVGSLAGGAWGVALLLVSGAPFDNKVLSWLVFLTAAATPGAVISAVGYGALDGTYAVGSVVAGLLLGIAAEKAAEEGG